MLSAENRLKQSSDFDKVYKKGKHLRGKYGQLVVLKIDEKSPTLIGIVIPAKLGDASKRNLAKRRIRDIFRANIEKIGLGKKMTFILWDIKFDYNSIKKDLESLISQAI